MPIFIELIVDDHPRGAGSLLWEDPSQRPNLLLLPNSLDHAWNHPRQHPFWPDLWWVSLQECGQSMPARGGTDTLMPFSPLFVSVISLVLLPSPIPLIYISIPLSTVYCLTSLISLLNLTSPPLCPVSSSCFASVSVFPLSLTLSTWNVHLAMELRTFVRCRTVSYYPAHGFLPSLSIFWYQSSQSSATISSQSVEWQGPCLTESYMKERSEGRSDENTFMSKH